MPLFVFEEPRPNWTPIPLIPLLPFSHMGLYQSQNYLLNDYLCELVPNQNSCQLFSAKRLTQELAYRLGHVDNHPLTLCSNALLRKK